MQQATAHRDPSLTIRRVRLYTGAMSCDLVFSYGRRTRLSYCVIEIEAGQFVGVGESIGVGRPHVEPLAKSLLGTDAQLLDALLGPGPGSYAFASAAAREGCSMALHDLVARDRGVPMGDSFTDAPSRQVQLMPCVFAHTPIDATRIAQRFVDAGYTDLKMKLMGDPESDAALVMAVRQAMPEGYLQGDVNLGYKTQREAHLALRRLADAGLSAIEDPLNASPESYLDLMAIDDRPLIIVDALNRGDEAFARWLPVRAADALNLHANCQGALSQIIDRADAGRRAGYDIQIGGTGYTGVGAFASMHVAAAVNSSYPAGEVGGWVDHGMDGRTCSTDLPIQAGRADASGTGHRGQIDQDYLTQHAQRFELSI